MLLLNIIGIILLMIVILLLAIILIPYRYSVEGNNIENKIVFSIVWLFAILKLSYSKNFNQEDELTLSIFNKSKILLIKSKKESKDKKTQKDKKTNDEKKSKKKWNTYINKAVIEKIIDALVKLWRRFKPEEIFIDAIIGFDDPMYTGYLCALHSEFSYLFAKDAIRLQPVFDEQRIEGKVLIRGSIWIFYFLLLAIGFIMSSPIRKIIILKIKERGGVQYV